MFPVTVSQVQCFSVSWQPKPKNYKNIFTQQLKTTCQQENKGCSYGCTNVILVTDVGPDHFKNTNQLREYGQATPLTSFQNMLSSL